MLAQAALALSVTLGPVLVLAGVPVVLRLRGWGD